jgi:GTPase
MPVRLAIIGRPNVGKSTLFNRLAGKKLAIVDDQPGVTRDRREATGRLGDLDLILIDTAGFEDTTDASLESRMRAQTEAGILEADICLFLIDARMGVTPADEGFADLLRRAGKPVILAANKAEGNAAEAGVNEAWGLGFGEPVPVSGEHGEGMSDLYTAMLKTLRDNNMDDGSAAAETAGADFGDWEGDEATGGEDDAPVANAPLRIAVIGRPNAGKSTLINAMLGESRLLTGPEAGITRDAISVDWLWDGRKVRLVDTAGMRRKAKVQEKLEVLSVADTLRSIRFAEICLLVMGADEAFEKQDLQIADLVAREGRGLVYVISKWDMVAEPAAALAELSARADRVLPQTRGAPLVPISSLSGIGLEKLMPAVASVHDDWNARIKTRDLNDWLKEAITKQPPPAVDGRRVKPRYIAQIKARPPTFVLLASRAAQLPDTYVRYLTNGIRHAFDLPAVPIRFYVRAPKNPYVTDEDGGGRSRASAGRTPTKTTGSMSAAAQRTTGPSSKPTGRGPAAKKAARAATDKAKAARGSAPRGATSKAGLTRGPSNRGASPAPARPPARGRPVKPKR